MGRSLVEPFCCVLSVGTERGHGGTKEERRGRACDRTFSCRRTERRASKAAGTEGRLYKKAESSVSGSAGGHIECERSLPRDRQASGRHICLAEAGCGLCRRMDEGVGRRLCRFGNGNAATRSEEHTSELQSLMRISYGVFCL